MAEPILYTIEFVASGTAGGESFTDEPVVFAGMTDTETIDQLNAAIQSNLSDVVQFLEALSVVAGLALVVASFFKLKQHKSNPQQTALEIGVSFTTSLTRPVVRDGNLVTLSIDSIQGGLVQLRTHRLPKGK